MTALVIIYFGFTLLGCMSGLLLIFYLIRVHRLPGVLPFTGLVAALTTIQGLFLLLMATADPTIAYTLTRLRLMVFAVTGFLWLTFVLSYTGHWNRFIRRLLSGLLVISALHIGFIASPWAQPYYFVMWWSEAVSFITVDRFRFGPVAGLTSLITVSTVAVGFFFIVRELMTARGSQRPPLLWIALGIVMLLLFTLFSTFFGGMLPLNLTPIGITLMLLLCGWGILRGGLFELTTAAQNTVFTSLPDPMLVVNERERVLLVNPAAQMLFAGTTAPVLDQPLADLLARQQVVLPADWRQLAVFELAVAGQVFSARLFPVRLANGYQVGRALVLHDITMQKQIEADLRHERKLLERMASLIPDYLHLFDLTLGRPVYLNRPFADFLGYTMEDLAKLGPSVVAALLHPDDLVVERSFGDRYVALKDGQIMETEYRWRQKSGGYVWLNVRESAFQRDANGKVTQILGIIRNVNERRSAEDERQQLLLQLQQANRNLTDFAYVISHDLKAPLRGVTTIADWLSTQYEQQLDVEGQQLLSLLKDRVQRMEQMIMGVLDYSRVGTNGQAVLPVALDCLIVELCAELDLPPHIRLTVADSLPTLAIDAVQLRQIFQNLIDNAIKFCDKPHGEIMIRCQRAGDMWEFAVQDNGPGIPAVHFERIFQLFETLGPKHSTAGSGIGLAIVKRIVEAHHGRIWVESAPGAGATFYFTLPIYPAAQL